jgi:hypothetical protein
LNVQFPFHTAIWIVLNMIVLGVLAALCLNQSFSRIAISSDKRRRWRVAVIISLITWFVARLILGHNRIVAPAQLIPLSSFVCYSSVALALRYSPSFRQAALSIPQERLIGIQSVRVGGFVFLTLLDMGLLPSQFALPAGYGDLFIGLTAPFVVYAVSKHKTQARQLAIAWNLLGLADFAVALVTGFTFIGPYVRQLARTRHSIAYLDYVLMIPGFAVPILVLMHINSLFGLFKVKGANTTPEVSLQGGVLRHSAGGAGEIRNPKV